MELRQIASFSVNHNTLERGIYISRIDGYITTYDIRVKLPNAGDYLETPAMHTTEHLIATYVRSSCYSDRIIYFEGKIPGATKIECGNYLEHDLKGAKREAAEYVKMLNGYTVDRLKYKE